MPYTNEVPATTIPDNPNPDFDAANAVKNDKPYPETENVPPEPPAPPPETPPEDPTA